MLHLSIQLFVKSNHDAMFKMATGKMSLKFISNSCLKEYVKCTSAVKLSGKRMKFSPIEFIMAHTFFDRSFHCHYVAYYMV